MGNSAIMSEQGVVLVEHGIIYGPSETAVVESSESSDLILAMVPQCFVCVDYRAKCSHVIKGKCHTAFEWAGGKAAPPACKALVSAQSPVCGRAVQAPCHLVNSSEWRQIPQLFYENPLSTADEKGVSQVEMSEVALLDQAPHLPEPIARALQGQCKHIIQVQRRCGHTVDVPCENIFKRKLPPCNALVKRDLDCGHEVQVECRSTKLPACMAPVTDSFMYPCGEHFVQPGICHKLVALRAQTDPKCPEMVECVRYKCGHSTIAPCHMRDDVQQPFEGLRLQHTHTVVKAVEDYCDDAAIYRIVGSCVQPVVFRDVCGHEQPDVPCHLAFKWANDSGEIPPCKHEETVVSPLCEHSLCVPCHLAKPLSQWKPWPHFEVDGRNQPWDSLQLSIDGEDVTCPELSHDMPRPAPRPYGIDEAHLRCQFRSVANLACGHSVELSCVDAFIALDNWECTAEVSERCNDCGHSQMLQCCVKQQQDRSGIKHRCENMVDKQCNECQVNYVKAACFRNDVRCNMKASVELDCEHEVSWQCGTEVDPRQSGCRACIRLLWDTPEKFLEPVTMPALAQMVERKLPKQLLISSRCDIVDAASDEFVASLLAGLLRGQIEIANTYRDILSESDVPPTEPPTTTDHQWYDAVFMKLEELPELDKIERKVKNSYQLETTRYGFGSRLTLLSEESLNVAFEEESEITLCVGVAFRHRVLKDTPPFRRKDNSDKSKKRANKMAKKKQSQGYDCVVPKGKKARNNCIYWVPGVCVPVSVITFRQSHECLICFDNFRDSDGVQCRGSQEQHFLCNDCFSRHVETESKADLYQLEKRKGRVFCPGNGCKDAPYSDADIAQHVPEQIFAVYNDGMKKLIENQLAKEIRQEERDRLEREQARLAAMDKLQREVHDSRKHIVEELLTLKCPRPGCRQAFVDFTGCFALTCSRCSAGFCAWCLADCGSDAHGHVPDCPENPQRGNVYGQAVDFDQSQKERRRRKVREFLQNIESVEVRVQIIASCRKDLEDLHMLDIVRQFGGGDQHNGNNAQFEAALGEVAEMDAQFALQMQIEMDHD